MSLEIGDIPDGIIEVDSEWGARIGFVSSIFIVGGQLWKKDEVTYIYSIEVREELRASTGAKTEESDRFENGCRFTPGPTRDLCGPGLGRRDLRVEGKKNRPLSHRTNPTNFGSALTVAS